MGRQQFNDGMEIDYEDLNAVTQNVERELFEKILFRLCNKVDGFFQDSFFADFTDATHVTLRSGMGVQLDNTQVAPESIRRLLYLPTTSLQAITTPDPSNPRIDIVCVKHSRATIDSAIRQYKDFTTMAIGPQTFVLTTDWLSDVLVVAGTPASVPAAPATPSGYLKIATLQVAAVSGMASQASVADNRVLMPINDLAQIDTSGFSNVATKAVGTPLKTVLSDLDALGVAAAQALIQYNAIVGTAPGCNYASLTAALAAAASGWRILVTQNQTINTTLQVAATDVEIHLKPAVSLVKGSATTGLNFQNPGGSIHGGKMSGFSGGGDIAIQFQAGANTGRVWDMRFANNTLDVDDSAVAVVQWGNYSS